MINIKCDCGEVFRGMEGKEDTCQKCLKYLIQDKESYLFVFLEGSRTTTEGKSCTLEAGSFGEATLKLQEWLNEHCMGVNFDQGDFISCGYHYYNNVYLVK